MAQLRRDVESFMAHALAIFPNINIRNTFLHCELEEPIIAGRSQSEPPRERPNSPRRLLAEEPRCPARALGKLEKPSWGHSSNVRTGENRLAKAPQVAAAPSNLQSSAVSSGSSPERDRQKAIAVVARGPPPYAPPVTKGARQEKQTARGPVILSKEATSPATTLAACASPVAKASSDISPDGDWAFVEVKRKKRGAQPSTGMADAPSASSVEPQPPVAVLQSQQHGLVQHTLEVGIADDSQFHVIKRLLGTGGQNMDRIRGESHDIKVELRGDGTKSSFGSTAGPLVLRIKGHNTSQCANALARATELVAEIRQEYQVFLEKRASHATGERKSSTKVDLPCDAIDAQEGSTSADDSVHALNDTTDSDEADALVGNSRAVSSSCEAKVAEANQGTSTGTSSVIHHEVPVGVKHTAKFAAVRKIIGRSGENMKHISSACPGTKVELRGAGTNPWNGGEAGPLVLHIRGHDPVQCAAALKRANALIEGVQKEYQSFLDSWGGRVD